MNPFFSPIKFIDSAGNKAVIFHLRDILAVRATNVSGTTILLKGNQAVQVTEDLDTVLGSIIAQEEANIATEQAAWKAEHPEGFRVMSGPADADAPEQPSYIDAVLEQVEAAMPKIMTAVEPLLAVMRPKKKLPKIIHLDTAQGGTARFNHSDLALLEASPEDLTVTVTLFGDIQFLCNGTLKELEVQIARQLADIEAAEAAAE